MAAGRDTEEVAQTFDWGTTYATEAGIRVHELLSRVHWFVHVRWFAVAGCLVGTLAVATSLLPTRMDWRLFAVVTVLLAMMNTAHAVAARRLTTSHQPRRERIYRLVLYQVLSDYLALGLMTYASGTLETPVLMLFLPHVIIVSLFFSRWVSLLMTAVGLICATTPMVLEMIGLVPTVSILGSPLKARLVSDPNAGLIFLAGLAACYLACWYLTSTITSSLRLREQQVEQANQMLARLDHEKTQATLRATHELKAPLAAIGSYVFSLRDGYAGELPDKARRVVERIGQRCDRLRTMITDIIHVSNLRSAVLAQQDFAVIDLQQLLAQEVSESAILGRPRGIEVQLRSVAGRPLRIRASVRHLRTLFSNLLRNAIKYSHDGGLVEVTLAETAEGITAYVKDRGLGIPPEGLPNIFDDYFRCNNAVRHNPQGNGLGLVMVKEIAKLHGAVIGVSSELGQGSCFSVTFKPARTVNGGGFDGKDPDHR